MANAIAAMEPLAPPEKTLYQSMTFGSIVGEIVRRTDTAGRPLGKFVQEEIACPLGLQDLWIGIPDAAASRVAVMSNRNENDPPPPAATLYARSMPYAVDLVPRVFGRPDVQRACLAGVGGIFNARDEARFWAMLAGGGEIDGVRLLRPIWSPASPISATTVTSPIRSCSACRYRSASAATGSVVTASTVRARSGTPGAGGSIGWADPDQDLAVAICHNRMFNAFEPQHDPILPISKAIVSTLGLEWNS